MESYDKITRELSESTTRQNARQLVSVMNAMRIALSERKLACAELETANAKLADVEARIMELRKRIRELESGIAAAVIFGLNDGDGDSE